MSSLSVMCRGMQTTDHLLLSVNPTFPERFLHSHYAAPVRGRVGGVPPAAGKRQRLPLAPSMPGNMPRLREGHPSHTLLRQAAICNILLSLRVLGSCKYNDNDHSDKQQEN